MDYFDLLEKILSKGKLILPNHSSANFNRQQGMLELNFEKLELEYHNYIATKEIRPKSQTQKYMFGEMAWYFSGDRRVELIKDYSDFWLDIANVDGTVNSNYGYLVFYKKPQNKNAKTSFDWTVQSLLKDKHTRQAVCNYDSRDFNFPGNQDYICTRNQKFIIRDNILHCHVDLRSSDAIFGLQYNMPWWSIVHQNVFLNIQSKYPKLSLGKIIVNIMSSHIYERHFQLAKDMIEDNREYHFLKLLKPIDVGKDFNYYKENINDYIGFKNYAD